MNGQKVSLSGTAPDSEPVIKERSADMHAIIETGGKQYKVAEGDTLFIEKLEAEAGQAITFDQVLAVLDGDKATFGAPTVEGASVAATVVKNGKGKKIRIFKYTPRRATVSARATVSPTPRWRSPRSTPKRDRR